MLCFYHWTLRACPWSSMDISATFTKVCIPINQEMDLQDSSGYSPRYCCKKNFAIYPLQSEKNLLICSTLWDCALLLRASLGSGEVHVSSFPPGLMQASLSRCENAQEGRVSKITFPLFKEF